MLERAVSSRRVVHLALLAVAAIAALAPFSGKAFNIDDPLFVWAAKHIVAHPFDFYGFDVHWYSTWEPMWQVTQNPPLGCYYVALVGWLFGWSETVLHLAMILPTWAALAGTYRVAERLGAKPMWSALLTLATPAFVLCSTSVMCDVPMLAFWLWTIVFWDEGLREQRPGRLWLAGLLIGLTTLTKYFGVCLLPLLTAYSLAIDRNGWRRWLAPFGLAVAVLAVYEILTWAMYGRGLIGWAMGYAAGMGTPTVSGKVFRLCAGCSFLGGCIGAWAFAGPFLVGRRACTALILIGAIVFALSRWLTAEVELFGIRQTVSPFADHELAYFGPQTDLVVQFVLWATVGAGLLILTWQDYRHERDERALLLALWVAGTFVFAAFVNWTLNGRSVLPLVPAASIILVRRLQRLVAETRLIGSLQMASAVLLLPSLVLALAIGVADQSAADAQRIAAASIVQSLPDAKPLWFEGHWGFQYCMMELGAEPWDGASGRARPGDIVVRPENNCNIAPLKWTYRELAKIEKPVCPWATTMHFSRAAGFYSEIWGPLPFTFGPVPPEEYSIFRLIAPGPPPKR